MNSGRNTPGYTLIELVVVTVLIAILAGFALQAIILSTETYTLVVREYLEMFKEGYSAMDRMTRELRETNPESIIILPGSISFTKFTVTPHDPSLEITFLQSGNYIQRQTDAGTHPLTANVAPDSFAASMNEQSVVTLTFTLEGEGSQIPFRSAARPRLEATPTPVP